MKKVIVNIVYLLFVLTGIQAKAQLLDSAALAKEPLFVDLKEALKNPDKVYKLDLHRNKLKEIPKEVFTLSNLQELNLSKNKLVEIPKEIKQLTNLEILDVSVNNIDTLYPEIGQLTNIRKLILNQNVIAHLPTTIGNLSKLSFLDMWGNEIQEFPKEIGNLKNTLKTVDLRVISIKEFHQEEMEKQLPNTKIFFSMSCNCN